MIAAAHTTPGRTRGTASLSGMLLPVMFGLTGFVAISHVEAAIEAVSSSVALAAILLTIAASLGLWARWAARGQGQAALVTGGVAFTALAGVWVCSRVAGLPLGLSPRAPVGVLDAVTAFDEILVAAAAMTIRAAGRRSHSLFAGVGFAALSLSFILLSMGCSIGTAHSSSDPLSAAQGTPLYCHLY